MNQALTGATDAADHKIRADTFFLYLGRAHRWALPEKWSFSPGGGISEPPFGLNGSAGHKKHTGIVYHILPLGPVGSNAAPSSEASHLYF